METWFSIPIGLFLFLLLNEFVKLIPQKDQGFCVASNEKEIEHDGEPFN